MKRNFYRTRRNEDGKGFKGRQQIQKTSKEHPIYVQQESPQKRKPKQENTKNHNSKESV